jgi:N-acetylglucosaminyldiphosphoundecaprenol N-acetyl-beta-D-mannosaminyltransferase
LKKILLSQLSIYSQPLIDIPSSKLLIITLNAHSYNLIQYDTAFTEAILKSDVLLPDGISIVFAKRFLTGERIKKIAGADLFYYEMDRLNKFGGSCLFLGSKDSTLSLIEQRALIEFPNVKVFTYSPPFKKEFSVEDDKNMLNFIKNIKPDVLFIGMTAPKQEKWAYSHFNELEVGHVCCIGAVFDFYAGTIKRAPESMIKLKLEWFYRFIMEPQRMWRRYLIGNSKFIWFVLKEKFLIY